MKWNLYDDTIGEWGEVVIKQHLKTHEDKIASKDEYGHVKIDDETLIIDNEGKLKVKDTIANTYSPTVYFNIGTDIRRGRIEDSHFYVPFDCKIKKLNVSLVQFSSEELEFNLQKTRDFTEFNNVLPLNLKLSPNTHAQLFTVQGEVILRTGDLLFVDIKETNSEARNMLIAMTIEKI